MDEKASGEAGQSALRAGGVDRGALSARRQDEDIAEATGIPKATIYDHLDGKNAVLEFLLGELLDMIAGAAAAVSELVLDGLATPGSRDQRRGEAL